MGKFQKVYIRTWFHSHLKSFQAKCCRSSPWEPIRTFQMRTGTCLWAAACHREKETRYTAQGGGTFSTAYRTNSISCMFREYLAFAINQKCWWSKTKHAKTNKQTKNPETKSQSFTKCLYFFWFTLHRETEMSLCWVIWSPLYDALSK